MSNIDFKLNHILIKKKFKPYVHATNTLSKEEFNYYKELSKRNKRHRNLQGPHQTAVKQKIACNELSVQQNFIRNPNKKNDQKNKLYLQNEAKGTKA